VRADEACGSDDEDQASVRDGVFKSHSELGVTWKLILKACWTEFEEEGGGGKQKFRFMECKQYPKENLYRFIGPRSHVYHVY
jgi:hypothetical protein